MFNRKLFLAHIHKHIDPPEKYLTLFNGNLSNFSLQTKNQEKTWDGELYYSNNLHDWSIWNGESISSYNNRLYIAGMNNTHICYSGHGRWVISDYATIQCSGNVEVLLNWKMVKNGEHPPMGEKCFQALFYYCTSLVSAPELGAEALSANCYTSMFYGTSITKPPVLMATVMQDSCYSHMFGRCTQLTTVPKLMAQTLAPNCYQSMFFGCTSLYVSDVSASEADKRWTIPQNGVLLNSYMQSNMFGYCLGTRATDTMGGQSGQSYIYYTQNEPI